MTCIWSCWSVRGKLLVREIPPNPISTRKPYSFHSLYFYSSNRATWCRKTKGWMVTVQQAAECQIKCVCSPYRLDHTNSWVTPNHTRWFYDKVSSACTYTKHRKRNCIWHANPSVIQFPCYYGLLTRIQFLQGLISVSSVVAAASCRDHCQWGIACCDAALHRAGAGSYTVPAEASAGAEIERRARNSSLTDLTRIAVTNGQTRQLNEVLEFTLAVFSARTVHK